MLAAQALAQGVLVTQEQCRTAPGLVPSPHQALPCTRSWLHPKDRVWNQAKSASSHSVTLGEDTDDKKETTGSGSNWWSKENEARCRDRGWGEGCCLDTVVSRDLGEMPFVQRTMEGRGQARETWGESSRHKELRVALRADAGE